MDTLEWTDCSTQDVGTRLLSPEAAPTCSVNGLYTGLPGVQLGDEVLRLTAPVRQIPAIVQLVGAVIMGINALNVSRLLYSTLTLAIEPGGWDFAMTSLLLTLVSGLFFLFGLRLWQGRRWAVYVLCVPAAWSAFAGLGLLGVGLGQADLGAFLGSLIYIVLAISFWWAIVSAFRHWTSFT